MTKLTVITIQLHNLWVIKVNITDGKVFQSDYIAAEDALHGLINSSYFLRMTVSS